MIMSNQKYSPLSPRKSWLSRIASATAGVLGFKKARPPRRSDSDVMNIFDVLISGYPSEKHAIGVLFSIFSSAGSNYSLTTISELTKFNNNSCLVQILHSLTCGWFLRKIYRISSPINGETILDVGGFMNIPLDIKDPSSGVYFRVLPEHLSVHYFSTDKFPSSVQH